MDRYWLKIKESIWFIPTLYSLISVVMVIIFQQLIIYHLSLYDRRLPLKE